MSQADESGETPEKKAEEKPAGQRKLIIAVAVVVALGLVGLVVYLLSDNGSTTAGDTDVPSIGGSAESTTQSGSTTREPGTSASPAPEPSTAPPVAEGDPAEAKSVAQQAATAISSGDVAAITTLSCDPVSAGQEGAYPSEAKAEVVGEPQINGDTATIDLRLTIPGTEPTIVPMPLTKKDGRWCVP